MAIFGSKDATGGQTPPPAPSAPPAGTGGAVSRLGEGLLITGTVEGSESLRLEGRLEGSVDLKADLVIGARAEVRATVHARSISVEGRVYGDLSADDRIELVRTARVEGTMKASKISIAEGAKFEGSVDMSVRKGSGSTRPMEER